MTTNITLIARDGRLYFPTGNYDDATQPCILIRRYDAGDCDTCPWPMVPGEYSDKSVDDMRVRLAYALYDERETNPTFPGGASILLPDGTPFDFHPL
jgi:hypothetical protein